MNLILLDPSECDDEGRARLNDARAAHIRAVLHAPVGAPVRVGLVNGPLGQARVDAVDGDEVMLTCRFDERPPPRPRIDLLLALPRPKILRRLWAQLAAMGVGRIILTNAERVERNYFDTHWLAPATYQGLLLEGLQQARDTLVPVVSVHRRFKVLIESELEAMGPRGSRLVAHPGSSRSIGETLAGADPAQRVLLAVGPEGGWNAYELRLLDAHGFSRVGMGPRILRTDTAAIALLALAGDALARTTD